MTSLHDRVRRSPRPPHAVALPALALAAILALTGCAGGTTASDEAAAGQPVEGGVLQVALGNDTNIINPHLTGSSVTATITRDVVDSLVSQDVDNTIHPWLATEWTANEDNTEYSFTLRDDVTFSDGAKLDAAAVKQNFDFVLDPANNSTYARSLLGPVTTIEAPDATTLVIRYDESFAPLLQGLSLPYLGIQSPTFLSSGGDLSTNAVGSGPFTLDSFAPGQGSKLTKRDDYNWGPGHLDHTGPAHLDGIEYRYLPESSTRLGALQSGQVQAIDSVPPADAATLGANDQITVDVYQNPGVPYSLQLNTTRAPFDDVKVRQAFQTGVDIDAAVEATFFGTVETATGPLSSHTEFADADADGSWKNQPDRANTLLDEAGWTERDANGIRTKNGSPLTVTLSYDEGYTGQTNANLLQALQSEYRKIGIDLVLDSVDAGTQSARTEAGDYDAIAYFFVRAEADILRTVYGSASVGTGNGSRVTSLDPLLDEAVGATSERRAELYTQVQREVIDQAYSVPLYVPNYQVAHTAELQGLAWATNAKPLFYNAWLTNGS